MNETQLIRQVARLAPWLAPLPGAYFIARASWLHLLTAEPWYIRITVAAIIGLVVEMVSLAGFHTRLDLDRWNRIAKDRNWERAPVRGATWAIAIYFVGVLLLLIVLEAIPNASGVAPVFMPFLGVAGALILSSIGQHSDRKDRYNVDDSLRVRKPDRKTETEGKAETPRKAEKAEARKVETESRKAAVLTEWPDLLTMPTAQAAELAQVTPRTIRNWRNSNGTSK